MAQHRITERLWGELLRSFREDPGNFSLASRAAGCTVRTAKKAWLKGWPDLPYACEPIKDVVWKEQKIARARVELEEERERFERERTDLDDSVANERARQQAIKSKEEEARLVQAARAASLVGLVSAVKLAPGLQPLIDRLGREAKLLAEKDPAVQWTPKERDHALLLLRRYALASRELAAAGQVAMEMERLLLGEPTSIVGVLSEFDKMPLDELVRAAGLAEATLLRARERGLVDLPGDAELSKSEGERN